MTANRRTGAAALCFVVALAIGVAPAPAQSPTPDPAPVPAPDPVPAPPPPVPTSPPAVAPTQVTTTTSSHAPAAKRKVAKREKPVERLALAYSAPLHAPDETGSVVPMARSFTDPATTVHWDDPMLLIIIVGVLGCVLAVIGLIAAPALAGILHRPARPPQGPGVRRRV